MILWWTVEANKSLRAMTKWVDNVGDYRIDCGGEGVKGLFWSITFIYVGFMPTVRVENLFILQGFGFLIGMQARMRTSFDSRGKINWWKCFCSKSQLSPLLTNTPKWNSCGCDLLLRNIKMYCREEERAFFFNLSIGDWMKP